MADKQVINGYQGEIAAINQPEKKFNSGSTNDLFNIISSEFSTDKNYVVRRIGIQTSPGVVIKLNQVPITIGKTGIYEVDDIEITSIILVEDNDDMIIDYIIKEV